MTDQPEFTESIESPEAVAAIELSEQDIADIEQLQSEPDPEPVKHRTILEIWKIVLSNAENDQDENMAPQWANTMVSKYADVHFADLLEFRKRFYDKVIAFRDVLTAEIDGDPRCLGYFTAEEDRELNGYHYKNVLRDWQLLDLGWQLDWRCDDPYAAVELGVVSEVHKMFFDQTYGLVNHLDNIQFQFTEQDQVILLQALEAFKNEKLAVSSE